MARTRNNSGRHNGYHDFHAERVRRRRLWRAILLTLFILAGSAAVLAVIAMVDR